MADVKKWDEKTIRKKLLNLEKIISHYEIEREIILQNRYTSSTVDALHMAYYNLKSRHCKIQRWKYGYVRQVAYKPRERQNIYNGHYINYSSCSIYSNYGSSYFNADNYWNTFVI